MLSEKSGLTETWYGNGKIRERAFFQDGKLEGERKCWREDGQILCHEFYKNGERHGECRIWYPITGQLLAHKFYIGGKRDGWQKIYFRNGTLATVSFYRDGKCEGEDKAWDGNRGQSSYSFCANHRVIDGKFALKKKLVFLKMKRRLSIIPEILKSFTINDLWSAIYIYS